MVLARLVRVLLVAGSKSKYGGYDCSVNMTTCKTFTPTQEEKVASKDACMCLFVPFSRFDISVLVVFHVCLINALFQVTGENAA